MRAHLPFAVSGTLVGVALSYCGATDFEELHRMTTLQDLRLFFVFAGTVALLGLGFAVLGRGQTLLPRPFHPGSVPGGLLFGIGWTLTGACPTMATVQLGEGKLPAVLTVVGLWAGLWLYGWVHQRYFRWDAASCDM